jgi:hypothetical protein
LLPQPVHVIFQQCADRFDIFRTLLARGKLRLARADHLLALLQRRVALVDSSFARASAPRAS